MSEARKRLTKSKRDAAFKAEFRSLVDQLRDWQIPMGAIDRVHDAARASLAEVKALTEYEDGKASRVLTVVAFLSAVVAAVFTRFASDYLWPGLASAGLTSNWFLPTATYVAFLVYALLVTWSVLRVLGAIQPTFNVPETWKGSSRSDLPTSMLFYEKILDVTPPKWGEAFKALTGANGDELKSYYAKCYIAEAYLVAEKVAAKLAVLKSGIQALRWAMGILLVFFALFSATLVTVEPTRGAANQAPHTVPGASGK